MTKMITREEAQKAIENMEENFPRFYVEGNRNNFAVDWCILHTIVQSTGAPNIPVLENNGDLEDRIHTVERYLNGWYRTGCIDDYMTCALEFWLR